MNNEVNVRRMRKPSVLFINRVYPPVRGATGRVLRDLAHAFAKDGWNVTVLTAGGPAEQSKDGAVSLRRIKAGSGKTMLGYFGVWLRLMIAALFMPRHQLVVTLTDPPLLVVAGRVVAALKGATHIHWCQDLYPDVLPVLGVRLPHFVMEALQNVSRQAMRSCDRVVVIGRCMAKHLVRTGVEPSKLTVIPNWPDHELVHPRKAPIRIKAPANAPVKEPVDAGASVKDAEHRPLFIDDVPKFRVLYSGNLGRANPAATILDAAELLLATNPEIEFVFAGDGDGFEKVAQERARRCLDNIRMLPPQPLSRLKDLMESGDIHLVSMKHEVVGMLVPSKLYAALAAGRPAVLIGPLQSEAARVIKEFGAGRIVAQGNAKALAEAITALRYDGDAWFGAQQGALRAAAAFGPDTSMASWVHGARDTLRSHKA